MLAVTIISLLVAVTVQFSKDMRQELIGSANYLASSNLGSIAKSGYNIGAAMLEFDGGNSTFDSIHEDWAKTGNSILGNIFNNGRVTILIDDLGGKIQLNSLVDDQGKTDGPVARQTRNMLNNLFVSGSLGEFSEDEIKLILDAITDWIDPNDEESGIEETESSFYLSRQPSYNCKNGPIEFIEELLLIRGITTDLYYGSSEFSGLKDLVTVHGTDGKININTAPALILQALSTEMSEELVENLIEFRDDEANKDLLSDNNWYTTVLPGDINLSGDSISIASNFFSITATAENRSGMEKKLYAVVQRQTDNKIALLSKKVE